MIQQARSALSKSLLREAKDALVLIQEKKTRDYFLEKISQMIKNREDPNELFTGERVLKEQLLAYLKQQGEIKTANVWARNLIVNFSNISQLKDILTNKLMQENINGILEIHLQDREINSPHIQFVGTKAEQAEYIIAQTLVELKYELSLESAMSKKNFIPAFKQDNSLRVNDLETNLLINEEKKYSKLEENYDDFLTEFKKQNLRTIQQIDFICNDLKDKIKSFEKKEKLNLIRYKGSRKTRIRNLKTKIQKNRR